MKYIPAPSNRPCDKGAFHGKDATCKTLPTKEDI